MRLLTTLVIILISSNCKPTTDNESKLTDWSIVGSWYTDFQDGSGIYDSIMSYGEIYVNDSTLYYQDEQIGQGYLQEYFISNDTIFTCFGTGEKREFIPMYKIDNLRNDTLRLIVNKEYKKGDLNTYWVRFPKEEKGHYDHVWTKENSDSLEWAVVYDYDRRRFKYYATLRNDLIVFDSMLRAGAWKWDMNEREIQERLERQKKREESQNSRQQ